MFSRHNTVRSTLLRHMGMPFDELTTIARTYPVALRADLQLALEEQLRTYRSARPVGVHLEFETPGALTLANLAADSHFFVSTGPLEFQEVDVGDARPIPCVRRGLWLARQGRVPLAVLITTNEVFSKVVGLHLEVAARVTSDLPELAQTFMREIESRVARSRSYRGKIFSLDPVGDSGSGGGTVRVHQLEPVRREEVILSERTLRLLERNVHGFIRQRDRLRALGLSAKKGLLFHGPPGTGKTHTIRYLASQLADHVTLLITGDQVALLEEYFRLARHMQPALLVIEDADLIARERGDARSPITETHLNRLLNEMDGLRPDTDLITILTTNRPDALETALTARPGRIDQAIEFPLPTAAERVRLIALHSQRLTVPDDVAKEVADRTAGATPAFIKELMRRIAQYHLEQDDDRPIDLAIVKEALDEMLFAGDEFNRRLLGGGVDPLVNPPA